MAEAGASLASQGVKTIYFIHGTFVGDDPFDISRLISQSFPRIEAALKIPTMAGLFNKDSLFKDVGQFTKEYCNIAEHYLGHNLECKKFCWSSGNHHVARVSAAFNLLEELTKTGQKTSDKILLVGHSHAGQLFALLTRMMDDKLLATELQTKLREAGFSVDPDQTLLRLKLLKKRWIFFVTLGTPPRYLWTPSSRHRILHIINHRLPEPVAGGMGGILTTRDGDYIQQLGVAGSDGLSPVKNHHAVNRDLNQLLDAGSNLHHWRKTIKLNQRLHPSGFNYLSDYGDQKKTPNFMATIFGHGIYTRYRVMLYNMEEIAGYFTETS